jgi:zinc transport system substrate-binding protein
MRELLQSSVIAALVVLVVAGCSTQQDKADEGLKVEVSIPPQAYIVERIGGSVIQVSVLLPPGQSPATYDPTPKQMADLSEADVYFTIGVPFETKLSKRIASSMSSLHMVDTRQHIKLRPISGHSHADEAAGESSQGEALDPHIWLDPMLMKIQARTMYESLAKLSPMDSLAFLEHFSELEESLDSLDIVIKERLEPVQGRKMYVFHPSYGYFANRYGLEQVAIQVEGKEPSARQLASLVDQARRDGVTALFVQPQFSTKTAQAVADAIGCELVPLNPLAHDYIDNMAIMAGRIEEALRDESDKK